uniref:Uncharacterized protein n=1 Tax=Ceratitis capitata TaxID=7213 RepID=W8BTY0_CERCA
MKMKRNAKKVATASDKAQATVSLVKLMVLVMVVALSALAAAGYLLFAGGFDAERMSSLSSDAYLSVYFAFVCCASAAAAAWSLFCIISLDHSLQARSTMRYQQKLLVGSGTAKHLASLSSFHFFFRTFCCCHSIFVCLVFPCSTANHIRAHTCFVALTRSEL